MADSILLIDDDVDVLRSIGNFFERHGYLNAGKEKSCFGLDCDLMWKRLDEPGSADEGAARTRFCNCSG